ncbi:hypothetical protein I7I53_09791 [Histoplasma capsulatum var. duboisii H88]|uniref:Uncharacterized protein n=1 Tax=Ajellomyces capsulatus (strain H88) TaxID=544711 RepID=A0A8A1L9G2_AJEC8|nr:hypothetical protein I7I53_09791 [Histoplasma capsulatum var. duboisii H88]
MNVAIATDAHNVDVMLLLGPSRMTFSDFPTRSSILPSPPPFESTGHRAWILANHHPPEYRFVLRHWNFASERTSNQDLKSSLNAQLHRSPDVWNAHQHAGERVAKLLLAEDLVSKSSSPNSSCCCHARRRG